MPQLDWNELDFLTVLAVEPEVEEYEVSHTYHIFRDNLSLLLTVRQYESLVQVSLFEMGEEEPIMDFSLAVRGAARRHYSPTREWLELHDCVVIPDPFFWNRQGDLFDSKLFPGGIQATFHIQPSIRVRFGWDWSR